MADKAKFIEELSARYSPKGDFIILGKGMLDGEVIPEVNVTLPLKTINRHGLIAGATGTGKTYLSAFDVKKFNNQLGKDYALIVRLHPKIREVVSENSNIFKILKSNSS